MSYATLSDALNALTSIAPTQSEILRFVRSLSVDASGSTTVLYAGSITDPTTVGGTPAWRIVDAMGDDVRHIGRTLASKVLDSDEFKAKVAQSFGLTPAAFQQELSNRDSTHPAKQWLNKGGSGPWATVSEMFVEATRGKVAILTESPAIDSVLRINEIPKLIQKLRAGNDITEISGLSREKYILSFHSDADIGNAIFRNAVSDTLLSRPTFSSPRTLVELTEDGRLTLYKRLTGVALAEYNTQLQKLVRDYPMTGAATKAFARLGAPFAILGAVLVGIQANEAQAAGRPDEARTIIEDYAAEMAGAGLGQAAGGAVGALGIAALAAVGVSVAAPLAVGIVLIAAATGGYFGGSWGAEIAYLFQDRTEAQRRDVAQRMFKLMFGNDYSLASQVPTALLQGSMTLDSTFSRSQVVEAAKQNIAWRYALRELNPFVVLGDELYAKHNTDGSLDLAEAASSNGDMTEAYLVDRAAMLLWKIRFDRDKKPYSSQYNTNAVQGNWDFVDLTTSLTLVIDGVGLSVFDKQVVFGTRVADEIDGSGADDRLYGMAGSDRIDGKAGADRLEGQAGDDTLNGSTNDRANDTLWGGKDYDNYHFNGSFGRDTVVDADGQGSLHMDGVNLSGLGWKSVGENFFESAAGSYQIRRVPGQGAGTGQDAKASLTITRKSGFGRKPLQPTFMRLAGQKCARRRVNAGHPTSVKRGSSWVA